MSRGGRRAGAGRRREGLTIKMPPAVIAQLEEIAQAEGVSVADIVKEAVLSFLEQWQERSDEDADDSRAQTEENSDPPNGD